MKVDSLLTKMFKSTAKGETMGKNRRILIGIIIVTIALFACGCSFKADEVNSDSALKSETSVEENVPSDSASTLDTSLSFDELFKNAVLYFKDEEIATRFCTIITNCKIIDTKETKMLISCVKRII